MPDRLHHAYLLVGDTDSAEKFLHSFWNEVGVELKGSPDFFVLSESLFGIKEARLLSERASLKAFTGQKVFFITPEKITSEAQNALLKTFEDPIEYTHFFLVAREEGLILPTLRSRLQVVRLEKSAEDKDKEAEEFLSLVPAQRLAFAKKFADKEKNLPVFLDKLMLILEKKKLFNSLKKVYEVRKFGDDRAAAPKLILEHLALVLETHN